MNQMQIRYLDKRIQAQRATLVDEINRKMAGRRKKAAEKFREEFERAYVKALSTLPKEELLERLSWVFREGVISADSYNGWKNGIFDVSQDGRGYYTRPELVIEIDGLVAEWNNRAAELIEGFDKEKNDLVSKLNVDMDALRDKLNLEGCDQAIKLLGDLVTIWTATIESIDKVDEPRPRRRK